MPSVLPEVFCEKSPILVQFIAKFARFFAQNRGKFASFYPYLMEKIEPLPQNFQVLLHFYALIFFRMENWGKFFKKISLDPDYLNNFQFFKFLTYFH